MFAHSERDCQGSRSGQQGILDSSFRPRIGVRGRRNDETGAIAEIRKTLGVGVEGIDLRGRVSTPPLRFRVAKHHHRCIRLC